MKSPDNTQRPIFVALAAGLTMMPAAFGGTTGWFTNLFAVYVGILALVWVIATSIRAQQHTPDYRPIMLPALLMGIAIVWCFAQAWVPVPFHIAHNLWSDAADLLGTTDKSALYPAISVNPQASVSGALRLAGYILVFLLCYNFAANERRAIRLLALITAAGSVYALYGIGLELSDSKYVLWYERDFEPGNLSSTFPNRNAFAHYAALCLLCACALLYRGNLRQEDVSNGWRRVLVSVSLFYLRRNSWLIYAAAILFSAILMTHSRGGLIVTVTALMMLMACTMSNAINIRSSVVGAIAITAIGALLFGLAGGNTSDRFAKIESASLERVEILQITIQAIGERPLLGTGLGTFSDIFAAYRTEKLLPRIDFAHNSFLENALEMGLPAAIVFYAGLVTLFLLFIRNLRGNRRAHPYPALAVSAMTVAFVHSLFDYPDQFPAVAITLAAILGIAAAQSFNMTRARRVFDGNDRRQL